MFKKLQKIKRKNSIFFRILFLLVIFVIFIFINDNFDEKRIKNGFLNYVENGKLTNYELDKLDLNCEKMIANSTLEKDFLKKLEQSRFVEKLEADIRDSPDRCAKLNEIIHFPKNPGSQEEAEFPLAYGILAYKDLIQFLFMLSSFYHPQNEYCIAVGRNGDKKFVDLLRNLTNCWPNVHFMDRPPMGWGQHEIINSVYTCFEFLSHLKSNWEYFQYLSGVDVPLKTNLEMVRIFKALNGTANVEIEKYQLERLDGKNMSDSPLPLFKSSLSALVPREAANEMVASSVPRNLLNFLANTSIPDEAFWGTLLANKKLFNISGSISGEDWLKNYKNVTLPEYYISRHQVWYSNCGGFISSGSCVFSIADFPSFKKRKELVAHKIYMNKYPAAFFCALEEIQKRTDNPDEHALDISFYENLPQVEMKRSLH